MYTIIGGDGKEYGPVTADQIRAWITAGRANQDTRIKEVGTEEWKKIANLPFFSGQAPGDAASPLTTAASAVPAGEASKLSITGCYERSWELLKANFWPLVGVSFLMMAILFSFSLLHVVGMFVLRPLLSGVISGGWYYFFLLKIRGQPATVGDAFSGFSRAFIPLVAIGLLVTLFTLVGFCLLILPGIYIAVAYAFACILAIDKGLQVWDAMETSRRIITSQWWRVFGLLLLGIPFVLLGAIALGVGIFVAIPLIMGAVAYAYEDLCNPKR